MDTNATDIATEAAAPERAAAATAEGATEAPPPAPGRATERLAALEARLAELEAENRALSLDRAWNARAAAEGIPHPELIEKWRPADETGIDAAMDGLKAFLDAFRKEQAAARTAHRPLHGSASETDARAPREPTARARAALEGFRRDSARAAG